MRSDSKELTEIAMLKVGSTEGATYIADNDMASSFCIAEEDVFPEVFPPHV